MDSPQEKSQVKDERRVIYYLLTICISEIYFGYNMVYLSAADFTVIAKRYSIDFDLSVAQGFFQGSMTIGGAIGAVCSSYFLRVLSRKSIIYVFDAIAIVLCFLSLWSDYRVFFVTRILQGVCAGVFSAVIPSIVKESSPVQMANFTGIFSNLLIISGLFFLYLLAFILGLITFDFTGERYFTVILLFPILLAVGQSLIIARVFPFETPKYLAQQNMKKELKALIQDFYKPEFVEELYEQNLKNFGSEVGGLGGKGNQAAPTYNSKCALIYAIFYAFLCPMVGINVIMSYGGEVVSSILPSLKPIMSALLMLAFLIPSALSVKLITKYGRVTLTIYGTMAISFLLYSISLGYFISQSSPSFAQAIILLGVFGYLFAYGITYAPIMWLWVAEAVQPQLMGYPVMINWAGAALVTTFFPIVLDLIPSHNPGYIFIFFATFDLLSLIVTRKFMLQTKDKSEHQIAEEYRKLDIIHFGPQQSEHELEMGLVGGLHYTPK